jgi:hypothetical protein
VKRSPARGTSSTAQVADGNAVEFFVEPGGPVP